LNRNLKTQVLNPGTRRAPVEIDLAPQIMIYHLEVSEDRTCHMDPERAQTFNKSSCRVGRQTDPYLDHKEHV